MIAVIVHGGAGRWAVGEIEGAAVRGVGVAVSAGWEILERGGTALDGVTAAVVSLEDDPVFNAGTGSVLNRLGEVEMDASVMQGEVLASGGVAAITGVRNPVLVARRVLERTECVLLVGPHATNFARAQGFGEHNPVTEERRSEWEATRREETRDEPPGTVGAVAIDRYGHLAAATSTGGLAGKAPGRVGDSPIPGAGNYATEFAAVSATGDGELMLRFVTAKAIADRIERGASAEDAARTILDEMGRRFARPIGVICLDGHGRPGVVHGTPAMPHAWRCEDDLGVTARMAC